jgi:hypothetical protein
VIFGACAGMCYNALWYFPVLIVIGGLVTVIWDAWMQQKIGKFRAGYAAKRRRARNEGGDAEDTNATQIIPPAEELQVRRPEAVKRKAHGGESTDRIVPVEEHVNSGQFEGLQSDETLEATPRADTGTHNFPVKVGAALIVGFLLSFIVVMVIRGTINARALAFDLFANM